ncbi:MAG: transporter substrate-binding domain-containing protein [Oscillospiraceae bacterium]|nr:transporter substrate-binding domain-containing protein [Oscillospiraceae bacterium]
MKKIVCIILAVALLAGMSVLTTACGGKKEKLVCGVTEYEPMNWREGGVWTGFDTEFALEVGKRLGMEVEFQLIDWAQKFTELNAGSIDAIWNGFTATAEENGVPRITLADMSYSYMLNTQCVIVHKDRLSELSTAEALSGLTIAAEAGSAGEGKAKNLAGDDGTYIGVSQQINTFLEVMTGAVDAAVIDYIMAEQLAGTGDFADIAISFDLGPEVFAIGFRQGDSLRDKVNLMIVELYEEGFLMELAIKYGIESRLVLDKTFGQ